MVIFDAIASGLLATHLFFVFLTACGVFLGSYFIFKKRDWEFGNKLVLLGSLGFVFTWILGILVYPVFRVAVRAANFDPNIPWATGIFEIKEHISSIGLLAALALLFLAFRKQFTPETKKLYAFLLVVTLIVTLLTMAVGFILTGLDSV